MTGTAGTVLPSMLENGELGTTTAPGTAVAEHCGVRLEHLAPGHGRAEKVGATAPGMSRGRRCAVRVTGPWASARAPRLTVCQD